MKEFLRKKWVMVVVVVGAVSLLFVLWDYFFNASKFAEYSGFGPLEITFCLIALGVGVFILVPAFIFFHGLYIRLRYRTDIALKDKGVHKMSLGLPTTVVLATFSTVLAALFLGFDPSREIETYLLFVLVGTLIAVATYITILFMRGARMWIKFRKDEENKKLKKWGRAKFIFAFYNVVAIILIILGGFGFSGELVKNYLRGDFGPFPRSYLELPCFNFQSGESYNGGDCGLHESSYPCPPWPLDY